MQPPLYQSIPPTTPPHFSCACGWKWVNSRYRVRLTVYLSPPRSASHLAISSARSLAACASACSAAACASLLLGCLRHSSLLCCLLLPNRSRTAPIRSRYEHVTTHRNLPPALRASPVGVGPPRLPPQPHSPTNRYPRLAADSKLPHSHVSYPSRVIRTPLSSHPLVPRPSGPPLTPRPSPPLSLTSTSSQHRSTAPHPLSFR